MIVANGQQHGNWEVAIGPPSEFVVPSGIVSRNKGALLDSALIVDSDLNLNPLQILEIFCNFQNLQNKGLALLPL